MKAPWAILHALLLCGCAVESDIEDIDGTAAYAKVHFTADCGSGAWNIHPSRSEVNPTLLIMGEGADDTPSIINVYTFQSNQPDGEYLYTGAEFEISSADSFDFTSELAAGYYKFIALGCSDYALPRNLTNVNGRQFETKPDLIAGETTYENATLRLTQDALSKTPITANSLFTGHIATVNGKESDYLAITGTNASYSCSLKLTRAVAGLYVHINGIPDEVYLYPHSYQPVSHRPDYICITASRIGTSTLLHSQTSYHHLSSTSNTGAKARWPYDEGVIIAEGYIGPNNWDESGRSEENDETTRNGMRLAAFMLPTELLNDQDYTLCLWLGCITEQYYKDYWHYTQDDACLYYVDDDDIRGLTLRAFSAPYVLKIQRRCDGADEANGIKYPIEANHFYALTDPTDITKPLNISPYSRSGIPNIQTMKTLIIREL